MHEERNGLDFRTNRRGRRDGDWVIPILDSYDQNVLESPGEINDLKQPFDGCESARSPSVCFEDESSRS
ncbi:hypothetical protein REPUB_Repub20aG0049700 [Reevesia pubescens]